MPVFSSHQITNRCMSVFTRSPMKLLYYIFCPARPQVQMALNVIVAGNSFIKQVSNNLSWGGQLKEPGEMLCPYSLVDNIKVDKMAMPQELTHIRTILFYFVTTQFSFIAAQHEDIYINTYMQEILVITFYLNHSARKVSIIVARKENDTDVV